MIMKRSVQFRARPSIGMPDPSAVLPLIKALLTEKANAAQGTAPEVEQGSNGCVDRNSTVELEEREKPKA
jgi:hypothetical protein